MSLEDFDKLREVQEQRFALEPKLIEMRKVARGMEALLEELKRQEAQLIYRANIVLNGAEK